MQNFIVIGSNRGLVLRVLVALHTFCKANCVVICARGTRYLRYSYLCGQYFELDFEGSEDEFLIAKVNRMASELPGLAIIACDCESSLLIARVRERLTARIAPTPDAQMVDCFDDKWHFYQFCRAHGLTVPTTRLIRNKAEYRFSSLALELGVPFVVKPVAEFGSKGVQYIASEEDFRAQILENEDYQYAPLVAQTYVHGTDIGIDLLAVNGKLRAFALQQRTFPQHPAARITFFSDDRLRKVAETLLAASGYDGVMNIDARIEEGTGKVFLFESNPRFWTSLLASLWCGLNFAAECIAPSAGEVLTLVSGDADIFYHPLFRPSQWRYLLFDRGRRGRMLRLMAFDVCTFGRSVKDIVTSNGMAGPPVLTSTSDEAMNKTA